MSGHEWLEADISAVVVLGRDLRTVLAQRVMHSHQRPGVWDDDNPGKGGTPCEECAARQRLHTVLAIWEQQR